jgi:crotonobetainyl-CoA:carnitine CoA-transferase CaiB-like acyl-CoA transferase
MSQIGEPDGDPQRVGAPIVDCLTARDVVIGVLASLLARAVGNEVPGPIDVSLFASAATFQAQIWQDFFDAGKVQRRSGHRHPSLAPAGLYRTKDGRHIAIASLRDEHFRNICKALSVDELISDPRFSTATARLQHRDELQEILVPILASKGFDEWTKILLECDVLAGPVTELTDIYGDPELLAALPMTELPEGLLGARSRSIGLPMSFGPSATGEEAVRSPAALGEHTREILSQVDYTKTEIDEFVQTGVTPSFS